MKSLRIALLATACISPAIAAEIEAVEPTTPGFRLLMSEELTSENVEPMPAPALTVGGIEIKLEKTTLSEIVAKFGGDIATSNKENAGVSWVCYASAASGATPASLTWFASSGNMAEDYAINFVVTEIAPDGATPTCAAPSAPLELTSDFPGLGAPVADVTARLPGLDPIQDGVLSYGGAAPVPAYLDFPDAATSRVINYAVAGGKVTIFTLMQVSAR